MTTRSTLLFLASVALAALAAGAFLLADTLRRTNPVAVYTLTPLLSKGVWRVRLELTGVPPGRLALLPPDVEPIFPSVDGARAPDVPPLPFWWIEADENGEAEFQYEVAPEDGGHRHALFFGSRLFAVPVLEDAVAGDPKLVMAHAFLGIAHFERGELAEAENHHPDIRIDYKNVTLRWWTHTAGGITDRDRELAARSAELAG